MADAVETYAGPIPWWNGISKTVKDLTILNEGQLLTKAEMKTAAGLDWTVATEPIFVTGDHPQQVKGYRAIRRVEDGSVFAIASDAYKPIQNDVIFDIPQAIIDDGHNAHWETAGSLFGGKIVWALMSLMDKEVLFDGDPSPYDMRLLSFAGHDARHALTEATVLERVVCANTLSAAYRGAKSTFKVRHTTNAATRIGEARTALKLSLAYKDRFVEVGNELFKVLITDTDIDNFLKELLPIKEGVAHPWKTEAARASIKALYKDSANLQDLNHTGYRLVQAVAEYTDHEKTYGKVDADDRRALSIVEGTAFALKTKAVKLLVPSAV
jgi:phage/plasmid-like protein (TIGR03299 family)